MRFTRIMVRVAVSGGLAIAATFLTGTVGATAAADTICADYEQYLWEPGDWIGSSVGGIPFLWTNTSNDLAPGSSLVCSLHANHPDFPGM
jgi:hypothetical protein